MPASIFVRRRLRVWLGTVVAVAALAGCTIGPSTRPILATSGSVGAPDVPRPTASTGAVMPTGPGGPGRTTDPIQWADCSDIPETDPKSGRNFVLNCGEVQVPKSYRSGGSGVLDVAVVKATFGATPKTAPALVMELDEPGRFGTHRVAEVAGMLPAEILAKFSVVVMDLRGTGDSVPIDCVSGHNSGDLLAVGADPTTTVAAKLLADLSRNLTFDCGDLVGPDLSDYSTVQAADDLDSVRSSLQLSRINFLGRGSGATLGAVYADRYPGRLGAVVLDGPGDPSLPPDKRALAMAAAGERALSSFGAACPTFAGGCPLGADPVGAVRTLVGRLGDTGAVSADGSLVSGGTVLLALTSRLGDPQSWPELAEVLAAADEEDYDALLTLLSRRFGPQDVEQHQSGELIYQCNDSAQRLGGASLDTAVKAARGTSALLGPFLLGLVGLCSTWPAPETALGRVTATGAPSILVLGSVDDPVAPYGGVRSLTAAMSSATLLSWQSGTHGGYPASRCVSSAVDSYLLGGKPPAVGTLCPP